MMICPLKVAVAVVDTADMGMTVSGAVAVALDHTLATIAMVLYF
jgi:hypothetical protein